MRTVKQLLFVLPLLVATTAFAQDPGTPKDRDLNLREYAELLRADLKAQRVGLITQIMELSDEDSATFWPIFKQYDAELTKVGEARVDLIDDYIKNYQNLSDQKADSIMTKAFDLEAQRAQIKKKYFDVMKTALSARVAAEFFQIENQIQHLVDLQIAASLPTVGEADSSK
jgi:hypothetical protein